MATSWIARAGFAGSLINGIVVAVLFIGVQRGLVEASLAPEVTTWGIYVATVTGVVCLIGGFIGRPGSGRSGFGWALAGCVVSMVVVIFALAIEQAGRIFPSY